MSDNNFRVVLCSVVVKTLFRSWEQDRDLGHQVSRPRRRPWPSGLETETETWTKWTRVHSSLKTMVSRSHHWLHQFQLVTEHSLKGSTNYGNRATGVGTKHAVLRPRPRPGSSGLKTKAETLAIRSRDQDLGHQVSRPRPGQNELECTRVSRPWSQDHNTGPL